MSYFVFSNNFLQKKPLITQTITDVGNLHTHEFFEISYVVNGTVRHVSPEREELFTNDHFLIIRPSDAHSFDERNAKSAFHRDIIVSSELFKNCCDFLSTSLYETIMSAPSYSVVPFSQNEFKSSEDMLKFLSSIDSNNTEKYLYMSKAIVCNFLLLYLKNKEIEKTPNKQLIDNILDTIKTPQVIEFGIPALTRAVNYSHGHLCRLIKQHLNKKLLDVLTEARMEYASIKLKSTDIPLIDIAASVGYDSLSHFISVFEKYYSISPYKFRKNFRSEDDHNQ